MSIRNIEKRQKTGVYQTFAEISRICEDADRDLKEMKDKTKQIKELPPVSYNQLHPLIMEFLAFERSNLDLNLNLDLESDPESDVDSNLDLDLESDPESDVDEELALEQ